MAFSKDRIKEAPADFVYIFATDSFINAVSRVFGTSKAATIKAKRTNEATFIKRAYGNTDAGYQEGKKDVEKYIKDVYGVTPVEMLNGMARGEMLPGKNYRKAVYGVGATPQLTFNQNGDLKVNANTGGLTFKGTELNYTYPTLQDRRTVGFSYELGGKVYTTQLDTATGKFYADTYGDSNGMQYANGTAYSANGASNVWQSIQTAMPMVQGFLDWILSAVKTFTVKNTAPAQTEFTTYSSTPTTSKAGFGIIGALILGSVLLGTKKFGKRK